MRNRSWLLALVLFTATADAVIYTAKDPAIHANEVGRDTGRSGVCAATSSKLVCLFDYPWDAVRLERRGGGLGQEGTWEPIEERDLPKGSDVLSSIKWVRICIDDACEIWPRSAFTYKTLD